MVNGADAVARLDNWFAGATGSACASPQSDWCSRDQLRGRMAMLALRSHVAEAAGASSSLSSRAPPSLGQDRSTPPSGAQSRRRRARGRRATRQGLLLADFSRARRLLACSPLALADAGADHDDADDGADAQQQAQQHQHQHQHQHLHSTPAAAAPCWQQHSQQLQQLKLLQQQQLL